MTGFRTIDLFSGAGGFSAGLIRAGADPAIKAVDLDEDSVETYRLNLPEADVVASDIRELDFGGWDADLVVGGPPCQGFSTLNRGRDGDVRNSLSDEMLRCVRTVRPPFVAVENVAGFLAAVEGRAVVSTLEELGYTVRAEVVSCEDFGVPQARKRALVIAGALGRPVPWPRSTHGGNGHGLPAHRTVGEALALLPDRPSGRNWHRDPDRDPEVHLERFRSVREGGSRVDLPPDLVLDCWKGTEGYRDVLGRLRWHRPATTIRTEFFRAEKGRFLHPRADRPITAREAARLQSFPDSFRFPEEQTLTSVARQIGNAMPPALAAAIGVSVAEALRRPVRPRRGRPTGAFPSPR